MKKFRFSAIHFVIIGLIFLGLLALLINLVPNGAVLMLAILAVIVCFVLLLIYQNRVMGTDELEKIRYVNQQAEKSMTALLERLPVGVIKIKDDSNEVEWFNPFAELIFTQDDGSFDDSRLQEIMAVGLDKSRLYADLSGKRYVVHTDRQNGLFYFFDVSSEYKATQEVTNLRPVLGIISVDNYDDLEDSLSEMEMSHVNTFVSQFVADFSERHKIFYRRAGNNRFYLFTDYLVLAQLMADKFTVINSFRTEAKDLELPLTLSMGFAYGSDDHYAIGQLALQNLNMAEVRGGDQVVVRENEENAQAVYFGGSTASTIKRTRTRTRAMMSAISDRIKLVDQVFIVGHRNLDMDALGAAVGMQCFVQNLIETAHVVYDSHSMSKDIERAIDHLRSEVNVSLLSIEEAMDQVTDDSLLIMVDHSKLGLTLSQELYAKFNQVIVVDHHRRDSDFPENAVIAYIESGASSACELVTELLQFQNGKKSRLSRLQASLLMAGIMLDTKDFTTRVTSRTFDVASYLRSCGSDSVVIQNISATDFDDYRLVSELILSGNRILPNVIISQADELKVYDNVAMSKAADTLLMLAGIEAAFVIAVDAAGRVCVSARSRSKINVQRIMEEMGGGGHFNLAAAQISDRPLQEVFTELRESIFKHVLESIE